MLGTDDGAVLDGPLVEAELQYDFERFADPLGLNGVDDCALAVHQDCGFILSILCCGYWLVQRNSVSSLCLPWHFISVVVPVR